MIEYAFLQEAYNQAQRPNKTSRKDPACSLYKKRRNPPQSYNNDYNDIYDVYMNETQSCNGPVSGTYASGIGNNSRHFDKIKDEIPRQELPMRPDISNTTNMPGIPTNTLRDAMDYSRFFDDDNMFQKQDNAPLVKGEPQYLIPNSTTSDEETDYYNNSTLSNFYSKSIIPSVYDSTTGPTSSYVSSNVNPWFDVLIFIAAGVLLIVILEHVLQMGIRMRR